MRTRYQRYRSALLPGGDAGLSLAEMVVAIAVIMVVLVSAGAAFTRMGQAQRSAESNDRATQLIQGELETIRQLPYALVGCYADDPDCLAIGNNVPVAAPENASMNELVVHLATNTYTGITNHLAPVILKNDVPVGGNTYKVRTAVTWADLLDPTRTGKLSSAASGPPAYTAKRVTVTVSWVLDHKTRTVTRQWLRSPSTTDFLPPKAGADTPSRCPTEAPVCNINVTEGQVLSPTLMTSKKIEFRVQMSVPALSATIKVGTGSGAISHDLTAAELGSDGSTLVWDLPAGSPSGAVPGLNTVSISVNTRWRDATRTKVVNWRLAMAGAYELKDLKAVADQSRTVSSSTPPPTAGTDPPEADSPYFCVNSSGTLLRYTAVVVDEVNVDEMDGYTPPTLHATQVAVTGLPPSGPNLTVRLTAHPTIPAGGYVNARNPAPGSPNKIRWSYGFQPGTTVFSADLSMGRSFSTVSISGERPGDGAAANETVHLPVIAVSNVSKCPSALTSVPPPGTPTSAPVVTDNGNGSMQVSWAAQARAATYNVWRAAGPSGTFVQIGTTGGLSITDAAPLPPVAGRPLYRYKFSAENDEGPSAFSPEASRTLTYRSLIRGDNPFLYYTMDEAPPSGQYVNAVVASKPISYWRLREETYYGYAYNEIPDGAYGAYGGGSVRYGAGFGPGQPGPHPPDKSTFFNNDATTYIEVPNSFMVATPGAITLEAWVKPLSNGVTRVIASKSTSGCCVDNGFMLDLDPAGHLEFLQAYGSSFGDAYSTAAVPNGSWHHVAATKTSSGVATLYIDGVVAPSTIYGAGFTSGQPQNSATVLIGKRIDGYPFYGNIADVALYAKDLSAAEVATHFNGTGTLPAAADSSLSGAYGGVFTGVTLGQPSIVPGAPGSSINTGGATPGQKGPVTTPSLPTSTTVGGVTTVEMWADIPAASDTTMLFSSGSRQYDVFKYLGWIGFNTYASDVWGIPMPAPGAHHYVFVFKNGAPIAQNKMYVDGVLRTLSYAPGAGTTSVPSSLAPLSTLGGSPENEYQMLNTSIDEFAMYPGELPAGRVTAHYNAGR